MLHDQEMSLQERVNLFLSKSTVRKNAFVAAAEAAEAAQVAEDSEMNEYLVRRAEQEVQAAQDKLDALKRQIEEAHPSTTRTATH